jgi:peptidoglycan/LPS O-acetylase OafA/YrhL
MKKSHLAFIISALVLISSVIWLFNVENELSWIEPVQAMIVICLVGFGIYFGIRRLKSERLNEPTEDEMSKKMLQKASSIAFYVSSYLWLILMYIADKKIIESDIIFGTGILGMALVFVVSFIVLRFIGLKNE